MSNKLIKKETDFIPVDIQQNIVNGSANLGGVAAFLVTKVVNATANVISSGVAYTGRIVKKSEDNANLVHEVGHKALAMKHCVHCGTQLVAIARFCSNCGEKQ